MKSYLFGLLFVWFNFAYCSSERKCCCKCCACCCYSGAPGSRNSSFIPEIKADFISFEVFRGYFNGANIDENYIRKEIVGFNNELFTVKSLIEGKLNTKSFLGRSYSFPHIHWNGSIPDGCNKHLCYMLAPLNIILHLESVRGFLESDNVPSYEVSDKSSCYRFFDDIAFIRTFRIYVNALERGESFTLDPGKSQKDLSTLRLVGKVDTNNCNSSDVISKFFGNIGKFNNCPKYSYFKMDDSYYLEDGRNIIFDYGEFYRGLKVFNCKEFCDKFREVNNLSCDYDVLFFDLHDLCRMGESEKVLENGEKSDIYYKPKHIGNLTESFKCCGNKYFLKGLLFFAAGEKRLSYDTSNDYFSIVYDKNAPDSRKPYVYCQLDRPLKYYSLRDIEEGINKMDGSEFPYKNNYLVGLFYEREQK